jgi:hypothetical protein
MKYSHFLFLSLFALLSLSSHGFEQEHEHDFHEEESEQHCISCHLLEFSIETNKLDGNFISTQSIYFFSKKENLNNLKKQNTDVRAPPIS